MTYVAPHIKYIVGDAISPHDCEVPPPAEVAGTGESNMNNLHAPSKAVFLIALALVILALLGYFVSIPYVSQYQFWLAVLGYVVLALGCIL